MILLYLAWEFWKGFNSKAIDRLKNDYRKFVNKKVSKDHSKAVQELRTEKIHFRFPGNQF